MPAHVSLSLYQGKIYLAATSKLVYSHLYFGGKNREKCQISDECSNNERLLLDEMHILLLIVKFCTKLSFTVF